MVTGTTGRKSRYFEKVSQIMQFSQPVAAITMVFIAQSGIGQVSVPEKCVADVKKYWRLIDKKRIRKNQRS
jgi:hypothetical protein